MMRAAFFTVVASVLVQALTAQVPLAHPSQDATFTDGGHTEWDLNRLPNPNGTDHLVFETVYSLLQLWPNTRMRHGHNVVPGIIPKGTTFYHGTHYPQLPSGPDWLAIDPEFSYFFCDKNWPPSDPSPSECWHIALATTRPLKILYFDGSSASKHPDGSLDTQDFLLWGETPSDYVVHELDRIDDLCEWVTKFGVDGIVRMAMNFEVMLCDFTSGVRMVSALNLARPETKSNPPSILPFVKFESINSGFWHGHFPGETRIRLDLAGLVSFYDTQLVPSLVAVRAGQERWDHRIQGISDDDLSAVKSRVEHAMSKPWGQSNGIDWKTLTQVIVDRFAQRLELMRHLLNSPATHSGDIVDLANKTQTQLRIMLTPYLLISATPTDPLDNTDLDWTIPVYKLCATTHTKAFDSESQSMTDSERLILQAVRGTSKEICRVVTKMWATGVYAGIDASLNTRQSFDVAELTHVRNKWAEDLDGLMAWLDWSVWAKCDPDCGFEEMCYLPTWPFGFPDFPRKRRTRDDKASTGGLDSERRTNFDLRATALESVDQHTWDAIEPETDEWIRPQPRCIKRVDPYGF